MSAHVLSIVLNELRNRERMQGLPSILSFFRKEFNKFNNTGALMLDKITKKLHFGHENITIYIAIFTQNYKACY